MRLRGLLRQAREQGEAADGDLLKQLEGAGMTVNKSDRAAFVEASKPIYEAFATEVDGGREMIDTALSLGN